uniref:Uncharacterized protein n=1 Tax=Anguilla anguilla TaxID=7936 RepID=A0A0E9R0S9_ANGAN
MVFYQTEVPGMQKKNRFSDFKNTNKMIVARLFFLLCAVNHMAGMLNFRTSSYNY